MWPWESCRVSGHPQEKGVVKHFWVSSTWETLERVAISQNWLESTCLLLKGTKTIWSQMVSYRCLNSYTSVLTCTYTELWQEFHFTHGPDPSFYFLLFMPPFNLIHGAPSHFSYVLHPHPFSNQEGHWAADCSSHPLPTPASSHANQEMSWIVRLSSCSTTNALPHSPVGPWVRFCASVCFAKIHWGVFYAWEKSREGDTLFRHSGLRSCGWNK